MPDGAPTKTEALHSADAFRGYMVAHSENVDNKLAEAKSERDRLFIAMQGKVDKPDCIAARNALSLATSAVAERTSDLRVAVARWVVPISVIMVASAVAVAVSKL